MGAWTRQQRLPSTSTNTWRAKKVSPMSSFVVFCIYVCCLLVDLSSSPIPFPFFLLLHSIAGCSFRLEKNVVLLVSTSICGSHGVGGE